MNDTTTPAEIARQIGEAYREYDDARASSLTEQAIALFGRDAMLAVLEDARNAVALMPLEDRKRDFELAVLDKFEARNGGDQNLTVGEVLSVAEVEDLAAMFRLKLTSDGEIRDAVQ
jgi:hypothetical protein